MSTHQYTGNMIPALMAVASRVRQSSVDRMDPWPILTAARLHICGHVMTAGDVQAWYLLFDLQEKTVSDELVRLKQVQCEASVGGGENPPQCQKAATVGRYCDDHYEE